MLFFLRYHVTVMQNNHVTKKNSGRQDMIEMRSRVFNHTPLFHAANQAKNQQKK